ncbi:MAG: acyltransferase [Fibromonadaceae bacterium]|jgi:peptidoglycan/LPS O-acetylase OafA/YrhL|nr:acyltransferase [Fibromonadaceae bacterium]
MKKSATLTSIQLLRAVAALSVVYAHCTYECYNLPNFGHFGVDIFFIISGFIIAYMVSKNTEYFFIKRIIRIVPLYFLVTIVITLAAIDSLNFISRTISVSDFIRSIFFVPSESGNSGSPIISQGWTLNYEIFFYVIVTFCIIFAKKYITIICSLILALIIIGLNWLNPENYIMAYYKETMSLEFIYGIGLYHFYKYVNTSKIQFNKTAKIIILPALAIISYGALIFNNFASHSEYLFRGIPALILVASILFLEENIKNTKIIQFGVKLGEASYTMYLIHFLIINFLGKNFNKIIDINDILVIELIKIIITFIVIIFFSIIIHRFIDNPIQNYFRNMLK